MLKKLILGITLLSLAPTTIIAGPAEFFAIKEEPSSPGPIDILASWYFMSPQNRLYKRQLITFLIQTSIILSGMSAPPKYARGAYPAPVTIAASFLQNYIRRAFEDGITKETFVQGLLQTPFSLEFPDSDYPNVILLNTLKYIYLAYEINSLIFDIENECAELEIESKITQQLVSPNNNYFVLPTDKALLAMAIHKAIPLAENSTAELVTLVTKYYQSLKLHMIPHATIAQLSPDLQKRCYQLSHRVSAL